MTTYAVFLRGASNAYNAVDDCVWVGESTGPADAKRQALAEGTTVYNGQYLDALAWDEIDPDEEHLAVEWQPLPPPY